MTLTSSGSGGVHIVTVGDLVLDVVVDAHRGLRPDDDTDARIELLPGGQAANVAAWAAALGAQATLIGPLADNDIGSMLATALTDAGVRLAAMHVERAGTVVSVVAGGERTLISDGGDQSWLGRLGPDVVPPDTDWLHVSAYPLLRSTASWPIPQLAEVVRRQGGRVSLDLSSAAMIEGYGVERFRAGVEQLDPDVLFANQAEWGLLGSTRPSRGALVLKRGRAGFSVVTPASREDYPAPVADIVDVTGAGDAVAAGYLVGGVDLALSSVARCVSKFGAQPGSLPPTPQSAQRQDPTYRSL